MPLSLGTILDGKFKIVQVLGEGGMGTVYKVEQLGTPGYYYAVKELLLSSNISEEEKKAAIDRFTKEIDLLRKLKHPHIASLVLPFQERGNYYFAMEFVPGRSLEKILEDSNGPLPEEKAIKWAMQVCEALSYIHSQNPPIILRDLKPGNVMITPQDEVMLIDFGIARRFDPNKRTNTENLGTISYASPEHLGSIVMPGQTRSAKAPKIQVQTDARSDIYSLGATLYHLLTNTEPDPIQTPAVGSMLKKNPKLRTMTVGNAVVCPIEQVVIKAMQQNRDLRFQSAEAMRVALQHCLPASALATSTASTIQIPAMSPAATMIVPAMPASSMSSGTSVSSVSLVCPKCGFANRPGAKFCKRDGQPLAMGARSAPPQHARAAAQMARTPIQARPVQSAPPPQPIRARPITQPGQTIQARPVQPSQPIRARPVTQPGQTIQARPGQTMQSPTQPPQPIRARPVTGGNGTTPAPVPANSDPYRLGLQNMGSRNYAGAIHQFKLALAKGASYDVLYNLGRAYRQYGQMLKESDKKLSDENFKLAAEKLEEALRYKSDALDTYFQLGMCYRDLALYAQATNAFEKALALAPNDPAIYYQLGMASMEQGYNRKAMAYFMDGLRIAPDHGLMLVALGRLYIENKQYPAAIETLRKATQDDPTLWEAWYELGRAHMLRREWKVALSALEQARQNGPYNAAIWLAMATCYSKINKKLEARQLINEVLTQDTNNAEALRLQKQV